MNAPNPRLLQQLNDPVHMQKLVSTRQGRKLLRETAERCEQLVSNLERSLEQGREELRLMRQWLGEVSA